MKTHLFSGKKLIAVFLSVLMLATALMPAVYASYSWIDESLLYEDRYITSENTYNLVGGITERQVTFNNAAETNQIKGFVLEVDINDPTVSVIASYNDGDADGWARTTVRSQAEVYESQKGYDVVAAVNADCYNTQTGEPFGLLVMDGVMGHAAGYEWFFAILKDGSAVIRPSNGRTDDVAEAVGGKDILIIDGEINYIDDIEHPRTAVGIKADGSLVFFAADGRQQPESCGMNYYDLAHTMLALGCVNAMALDGGGSTTVITQREATDELVVRNKPSYGVERTIGSSLLICTTAEPTGVFDRVAFSVDKIFCAPLTPVSFSVTGVDKNGFETAIPEGGYLELADDSFGSISGTTFMPGTKTGTTSINYVLDGEVIASIPVEVSNKADNMITAFFKELMQSFMNIFNLIQTLFQKLGERLPG